jgi:hypothetical protein
MSVFPQLGHLNIAAAPVLLTWTLQLEHMMSFMSLWILVPFKKIVFSREK